MDFFYIIHYIVYSFYRRHKENKFMSMLYACGVHILLSFFIIGNIIYFIGLFLDLRFASDKSMVLAYVLFGVVLEFFMFFRGNRYITIFEEYDRQSTSTEMKYKLKEAKVFNYSLLIVDIVLLFIADYCNHHK